MKNYFLFGIIIFDKTSEVFTVAEKNYKNQNKKGKAANVNKNVGIVLALISAFMLVCLITRSLILGVVGEFIFRVWVGLFGCCAYPLFVFLILFGIMRVKNLKINVKRKYIVATAIVAFCVLQILQIATTTSFIRSVSYGDYLGRVYMSDLTAGGLIAGLTAYPVSWVFSPIGAYLLFLVISLITVFFVSSFGTALFDKRREDALRKRIAEESGASDPDSPGLFVYTFENSAAQSTTAEETAGDRPGSGLPQPGEYNEYSQADEFTKTQTDRYWDELIRRRNAQKTLFEDNDAALERFKPQKERDEYKNDILASRSQYVSPYAGFENDQTEPKTEEQPKDQQEKQPFGNFIPEKNIESRFVAGEIINGDVKSAAMSTSAPQPTPSTMRPSSEEKDDKPSEIPLSPIPEKNNFDYSSLPPITNGDRFGEQSEEVKEEVKDEEPVQAVQPAEPEKQPEQPSLNQREQIGMRFEKYTTIAPVMPGPIVNGETYKSENDYKVAPQTITADSGLIKDKEEKQSENEQIRTQVADNREEAAEETEENDDFAMPDADETDSCDDYREISNDEAKELGLDGGTEDEDEDIPEGALVYDPDSTDLGEEEAEDDESPESEISDETEETEEEPEEDEESDNEEKTEDIGAKLPTADEIEIIKQREREEAFKTSTKSFFIDDNVEDLTTTGSQSSQALNAYYSNLSPSPQEHSQSTEYVPFEGKTEVKKTIDVKKDQISIDDYAAKKSQEELSQAEKPEEKPVKKVLRPYVRPQYDLLTTETEVLEMSEEEAQEKTEVLEQCLESLGIPAKVINITEGPAVTRYELEMPQGLRVSKIEQVAPDIQYNLACTGNIRIQTPIPGKRAVGIEVPKAKPAMVGLKDVLESPEFQNSPSPLTVALGKDVAGKNIVTRLDKLPHLLIAGTTGSGKSACLNSLIVSLIYKASPTDVKIILVDPKCVEFTPYVGIPHLLIKEPITESKQAIKAFAWVRNEMNRRYTLMQAARVRNITEYNALDDVKDGKVDKLPFIVFIVDEYAELMVSSSGSGDQKKILEEHIQSITQKARAAGIHLILATQRPSADVITGTIKANLPSKIAFKVSNRINSGVILDRNGAEALVGRGDMLFLDASSTDPIRVQGAYIDNDEIQAVVDFCRNNNDTDFSEEFSKAIKEEEKKEEIDGDDEVTSSSDEEGALGGKYDKDIEAVARMVLKTHNASGAMIQRRFSMGYVRAVKIVDQLEELGCIGPLTSSNKRDVLLTEEKFKEIFGHYPDEE